MDGVEAVLLVGGLGTRLRPLTVHCPKPMLPVAGVPFVLHQLARARAAGVTRVVLATSYRPEIFAALGDGSDLGLELVHVHETEPLGTGGGIRNAAASLLSGPDDPVVVFNGDVLSGHDLVGQLAAHAASAADVTLHLVEVEDARAFGSVPTDEAGRVLEFVEKSDDPPTNAINAGCYVFRRSVIDAIPTGRPVSVERETFPGLLSVGCGGPGLRRLGVLARPRDAGGLRPWLGRSRDRGDRRRPRCPALRANGCFSTGRRWPPTRSSRAARSSAAVLRSAQEQSSKALCFRTAARSGPARSCARRRSGSARRSAKARPSTV